MKDLITYVLWGSEERYWNNIPYLLVANSILFPNFYLRFYVHEDSISSSFFVFLKELSKNFEKIELEILTQPYQGTQLTIQRMKPLWENDINHLFCRDIDYALSGLEKQSMDHFMKQKTHLIHSIRGRHSHHLLPLYAGLCGFKVEHLQKDLKKTASSFKEYVDFGQKYVETCPKGVWQCDQYLLKNFFYQADLYKSILDCPVCDAPDRLAFQQDVNLKEFHKFAETKLCLSKEYNKKSITHCPNNLINYLDSLFNERIHMWHPFEPFMGRSWTCTSSNLLKLLKSTDNEVSNYVLKLFKDNFGGVNYRIHTKFGVH